MSLARPLTVLVVAAAAVLPMATPASAAQLGYENTAAKGTPIAWAADATVTFAGDSANIARAVNRDCPGCRTGIVAFELVVLDHGETATPYNEATAYNEASPDAFAFADARQVVVTVPGATRLSEDGREELAELRRDLRRLDRAFTAGATAAELDARLDRLERDLRELVDDLDGVQDSPDDDREDSAADDD